MPGPFQTRPALRQVATAMVIAMSACSGTAFAATYRVAVTATSGGFQPGPTDAKDQSASVPLTLPANSSHQERLDPTRPGGPSLATSVETTAAGRAAPGVLQLSALASARSLTSLSQGPAQGQSSASGTFNDAFTVLAAGCSACSPGARGTLKFAIDIDGAATGGGAASSVLPNPQAFAGGFQAISAWNTRLSVQAFGGSIVDLAGSGEYQNNTGVVRMASSGIPTGQAEFELDFRFGQPISLQWSATVSALAGAGSVGTELSYSGSANALADFSHTFAWDGIASVVDARGVPVAAFTAVSADGTNYALSLAPVPEPSRTWLLIAGLAAMVAFGRRRLRA